MSEFEPYITKVVQCNEIEKMNYLIKQTKMKTTSSISMLGVLFIAGILPVSSVALHSMGLISIRAMILPNVLMISICCYHLFNDDTIKKLVTRGWVGGLVAVLLYDLARIPFVYLGWDDFIPGLGGWIVGSEENFAVGYLWRYLGNGAGLGLGFAVLCHLFKFKKIILAGLVYGIGVFLALDIVLLVSETAQSMMFKITPLTFTGSLVGHAVYGLTIGFMVNRMSKSKE